MVFKNKSKDNTCSKSALSKKREKNAYKGKKKTNFKKYKCKMDECCICYETFPVTVDNTISCNKTVHTLCSECKDKLVGGNCPMCRSHTVKPPSKIIIIPVYRQKLKTNNSKYVTDFSMMSSKQRRNFYRKDKNGRVIGQNQIIRERTGWTTRYMGLGDYLMWFSDERVARYNGGETTEYDSDEQSDISLDDSSDDSSDISLDDTVSTLSLTDTSVGEMDAFSSDEEDSTEDEEVNGFIRFYIDRSLSFEENLRNYYNSRMVNS